MVMLAGRRLEGVGLDKGAFRYFESDMLLGLNLDMGNIGLYNPAKTITARWMGSGNRKDTLYGYMLASGSPLYRC